MSNQKIKDYEPIKKSVIIEDNERPDDLSTLFYNFTKKLDFTTSIFIFVLYILINTDCFQLYIVRELYSKAYDPSIDSITDSGIMFNGLILSIFYLIFDLNYNKMN